MDQRHAFGHELEPLGRDLAQLAADHQQAIGRVDQVVGDARVAAVQPGRQGMDAWNAALAAHRMRHRDVQRLGQFLQRRIRARQMDAAAGQDQRPLRLGQERRGAGRIVGGRAHARAGNLPVRLVDPEFIGRVIELAVANVLRHVEHDRSRPAARRDGVGAAHQFRNARAVLYADDFLDDRRQNLHLPAFLGHVLPRMLTVGVAGQRDDRDARVVGFREAGDEIGHARPERAVAHAGLSGHPCVGVRSERTRPLVVDQRVAEP